MSRPSFPFYPDNYMNDAGVRRCSKGTRGIWVDLLCLMHQGTPYGHLAGPGGNHPIKFLATWCGETPASINAALEELRVNGVYSVTANGTIFNRRMVRDEHNRTVRGAGGVKASENANVPRRKDTLQATPEGILHAQSEGILPTGIGKGKGRTKKETSLLDSSAMTEIGGKTIPAWAEHLYARHPKKKYRGLVDRSLVALAMNWEPHAAHAGVGTRDELFLLLDRVHAQECQTVQWNKEHAQFCPILANWIDDEGYTANSARASPDNYPDPPSEMSIWRKEKAERMARGEE